MACSPSNKRSISAHPFRKKWGQNFLRDPNIITKIIDCLNPDKEDTILEIGPGDGALTDQLFPLVKEFHAIEIDPLLVKQLQAKQYLNVTVYKEDILDWVMNRLPGNIKIIGNLPYYISSPILFKLLESNNWERMVLMFQKEVAQRIVSRLGNKSYGRLSVMCQVFCNVKIEFTVSKNVFCPKNLNADLAIHSYPYNVQVYFSLSCRFPCTRDLELYLKKFYFLKQP